MSATGSALCMLGAPTAQTGPDADHVTRVFVMRKSDFQWEARGILV